MEMGMGPDSLSDDVSFFGIFWKKRNEIKKGMARGSEEIDTVSLWN